MNIIQLDKTYADGFLHLRMQLFRELGELHEDADYEALQTATKTYYLDHVNKDLFSWGIQVEGQLVSIGSLCLFERLPYAENLSGREGYILNVYTHPDFRNRGFAGQILKTILAYSAELGLKRLWLSSSTQGKSLYGKLGFCEKNHEMEYFLK